MKLSDLNSQSSNFNNEGKNQNNSQQNNSQSNSFNQTNYQNNNNSYEQMYNTYQNMSQNELMNQLIGKVNQEKKNGTFDVSSIENSLKAVMPFLNEEQQKNLITLFNQIK